MIVVAVKILGRLNKSAAPVGLCDSSLIPRVGGGGLVGIQHGKEEKKRIIIEKRGENRKLREIEKIERKERR